jgi:hypothetical protein
MRIVSKW